MTRKKPVSSRKIVLINIVKKPKSRKIPPLSKSLGKGKKSKGKSMFDII